jgi:hypothetical protein
MRKIARLYFTQPGSPPDRFPVLLPPFYLKEEAESSFRNVFFSFRRTMYEVQKRNFTHYDIVRNLKISILQKISFVC